MQGAELYDDPEFLAGYQELRRAKLGLNDELEIPALAALLPAASGLRVLDLGCGEGGLARRLADDGASDVLAVDASASMLANAVRHPRVRYLRADLACLDLQEEFDLVVSSLALHYVADFDGLVARIARRLTPAAASYSPSSTRLSRPRTAPAVSTATPMRAHGNEPGSPPTSSNTTEPSPPSSPPSGATASP